MTDCVEADCLAAEPSIALGRLIAGRHSCRAFLSHEVEKRMIEDVFASAQRAASWCNAQPWQVAIVSGPALERLRTALQAASGGLLVCTVAFGYEDAHHPANSFRTSRASLSDVIAWVDQ